MSQELAKRCSLESVVLRGREDGRGPSAIAILWFGIFNVIKTPFRPRVDAVHLGDMAIWPLGYLELLFGRTTKLVISAHGSDVSLAKRAGWRPALYGAYLRLGARLAGRATIIANSSYIANLASSIGFKDVAVVPLGTDVVAPIHKERSGLLFAGRISRAKGLRFLITEVLPLLPDSTRLRVAGPIWEETERPLLDHPQVEHLGILSQQQLADEYARAVVTLIPSQIDEGFGLVAIEAAACGSQVIASDGGGLREAVRQPWGDIVDPFRPEAWRASIMRRMSLSGEELERISRQASQDVDLHFRWRVAAERTVAHYAR
jgi:glycosyltransferase involved in cell wall biosynthesis